MNQSNARSGSTHQFVRHGALAAVLALTTAIGAANLIRAQDVPGKKPDAQKDKLSEFAGPLLAQTDRLRGLKNDLAEGDTAARRAEAELRKSELTLEIAKNALDEFQKGNFPAEIQQAEADIALARSDVERANDQKNWADRMLKKGSISESQHLANVFELQKAEFTLKQARTKREVLEKYTKHKEVARLERAVKEAEEQVAEKKALDQVAKARVSSLKENVERESPTPGEIQVFVLLDEAAKLDERGQREQSIAKLDEAERLARSEQQARSERKFRSVLARVRQTLGELKSAKEAR
jgi:hypothetical protein